MMVGLTRTFGDPVIDGVGYGVPRGLLVGGGAGGFDYDRVLLTDTCVGPLDRELTSPFSFLNGFLFGLLDRIMDAAIAPTLMLDLARAPTRLMLAAIPDAGDTRPKLFGQLPSSHWL